MELRGTPFIDPLRVFSVSNLRRVSLGFNRKIFGILSHVSGDGHACHLVWGAWFRFTRIEAPWHGQPAGIPKPNVKHDQNCPSKQVWNPHRGPIHNMDKRMEHEMETRVDVRFIWFRI